MEKLKSPMAALNESPDHRYSTVNAKYFDKAKLSGPVNPKDGEALKKHYAFMKGTTY